MAAVAGISTSQARRGSRSPNSAATSRSATLRAASAIKARPAGVWRRSSGRVIAELSRSLRRNTRSIATAASRRLGPVITAMPVAIARPSVPATAKGSQSGPGIERLRIFSPPMTPATSASAIAHDQTSVVTNR